MKMAIDSSSLIRLSGMNSGLDTEALVEAMSAATKQKIDNNTKKLTKLEWKQEQYRDVISKLTDFQNKYFDVLSPSTYMKSSSFLNVFSVSGGANGVSIKTSTSSVAADYKVSVKQLAQKESYIGTRLPNSFKLDFTALDGSSKGAGEYSVNVTMDNITREVKFSGSNGDELAQSFNESVKKAFGTTESGNGFVEVDSSGNLSVNANQNIRITENDGDFGLSKYTNSLEVSMSSVVAGKNTVFFRKEGDDFGTAVEFEGVTSSYFSSSAMEENNDIKELYLKYKQDAYLAEKAKDGNENLSWDDFEFSADKAAAYENSSRLRHAFYEAGLTDVYVSDGKISTGDGSNFTLTTVDGGTLGIYKESASNVTGRYTSLSEIGVPTVSETDEDGNVNEFYKFTINEVEFKLTADAKISDLISAVNSSSAGVTMTYSTLTDSLNIESSVGGNADNVRIKDDNGVLSSLNILNGEHIDGQNAIYTINDREIQSTSNSYTIDGTTITFNADVALNTEISFTTSRDTEPAKERIMSFVEDYNKLIDEIGEYVYQKPTYLLSGKKRYDPLTEDEMESLSESQIEKWEDKAKQGLLYQDSTIKDVMSRLRTSLYKYIDTKTGDTFSLIDMGITTSSSYSDNGKLVVDEDKLNQALEQNFDKIVDLFNSENSPLKLMDSELTRAVKATGARESKGVLVQIAGLSTGTSLTDNRIYDEMKSISELITKLETRYQDEQDRYWSKFTYLEQQMSTLNSQQSYITSMFSS